MNSKIKVMKIAVAVLTSMLLFFAAGRMSYGQGVFDRAGLTERTGVKVPLDASFRDEDGRAVTMKELLGGKPVVLLLTYYRCSHICPEVLAGITDVLGKMSLAPGKDYSVITLSFDSGDTPADAKALKANYLKPLPASFPAESWKFLTGDEATIRKVLSAAGYGVKREPPHGFDHPEVLIFLSPEGKISSYRYVTKYRYGVSYPVTFSPVDFTAAIRDASSGKVAAAEDMEPLYCFLYEPQNQEIFYRMLKIAGVASLIALSAFFAVLGIAGRTGAGRKGSGRI
jgi:protein SCO1/2